MNSPVVSQTEQKKAEATFEPQVAAVAAPIPETQAATPVVTETVIPQTPVVTETQNPIQAAPEVQNPVAAASVETPAAVPTPTVEAPINAPGTGQPGTPETPTQEQPRPQEGQATQPTTISQPETVQPITPPSVTQPEPEINQVVIPKQVAEQNPEEFAGQLFDADPNNLANIAAGLGELAYDEPGELAPKQEQLPQSK